MDKDYARDGFKVIPAAGLGERLNSIKSEIVGIFNTQIFRKLDVQEYSWEQNLQHLFKYHPETFINCAKQCQNLISIHKLMIDDYILNIIGSVAGVKCPVINSPPVITFSNKNLARKEENWRTGRHVDFGTTQGSLNSVVVWIGLTDINQELGPLKLWKGSHLKGGQWTHIQDNFARCDHFKEEDSINVQTKLGDILIFNQLLVHASGTNLTDTRPRLSISQRFNDLADSYWIDNGYYSPYSMKLDNFGEFKPTAEDMEKVFNVKD